MNKTLIGRLLGYYDKARDCLGIDDFDGAHSACVAGYFDADKVYSGMRDSKNKVKDMDRVLSGDLKDIAAVNLDDADISRLSSVVNRLVRIADNLGALSKFYHDLYGDYLPAIRDSTHKVLAYDKNLILTSADFLSVVPSKINAFYAVDDFKSMVAKFRILYANPPSNSYGYTSRSSSSSRDGGGPPDDF